MKSDPTKSTVCIAAVLSLGIGSFHSTQANQAPSAEFTQIQDLKADSESLNKPVKQKWAVVIGLSKYKDRRLDNDNGGDKSARDFYAYLTNPKTGRFANDHVKLLTNEEASYQNIANSLGKPWLGTVAGKDDLVVVFIASNSFPTTDGGSYICSYNCALDNIYSTCFSLQSLMQTLKKNVAAERVVLVLQAGYSGAAELSDGAKSLSKSYNIDPEKLMLGRGYVILSSSKPDQLTWGDVFSVNLIKALQEQDGMIPLRAAFDKAKAQTEYDTTNRMVGARRQTPVLKSEWKGNDLVIGAPPLERVSSLPADVSTFLGAESHYLKASRLANEANLEEAVAQYKLALAADKNYADAAADLGAALALLNRPIEAAIELKKAIDLKPTDVLYRTNYARVLSSLGKNDLCLAELEAAYNINPKDRVVLTALSSKALQAGDAQTASRFLQEAADLYPNSAQLHDKLAYAESLCGNLDNALAHAERALSLDPKLGSAFLTLGTISFSKGNYDKAQKAYQAATDLDPKNADAWYLLASVYEKSGQIGKRSAALSRFLETCHPGDPRLKSVKETMGKSNAE